LERAVTSSVRLSENGGSDIAENDGCDQSFAVSSGEPRRQKTAKNQAKTKVLETKNVQISKTEMHGLIFSGSYVNAG
jgi:hypothetical protein